MRLLGVPLQRMREASSSVHEIIDAAHGFGSPARIVMHSLLDHS